MHQIFANKNYKKISLTEVTPSSEDINQNIKRAIEEQSEESTIAYGGYLEHRKIYEASSHFDGRSIHLGVDFWAEAGTPIYSPFEGVIHSVAYNDAKLDYGATLICTYNIGSQTIHFLYGHISKKDITKVKKGDRIRKGQVIAHIGSENEGGGWFPHLHLQCIYDLEGKIGDYPGVCKPEHLSHYKSNCPDPLSFIEI